MTFPNIRGAAAPVIPPPETPEPTQLVFDDGSSRVFTEGGFLHGLKLWRPAMDVSACEWLGTFVGYPVPAEQARNRSYLALLHVCRRLPARVEHCDWLQKKIDLLRADVEALSHVRYRVEERDEGVDAINRLWGRATALRKKLHAESVRQFELVASQKLLQRRQAAGLAEPAPPTATEPPGLPDPVDPPRTGTLKRRRLTPATAAGATDAPVPVAPYVLAEAQQQAVRDALARAWPHRDGSGLVPHAVDIRLGTALAGVVNGTYPTHLGHAGPRARRFSVEHVVAQATAHMTPWHGDAVRAFAAACIRALETE